MPMDVQKVSRDILSFVAFVPFNCPQCIFIYQYISWPFFHISHIIIEYHKHIPSIYPQYIYHHISIPMAIPCTKSPLAKLQPQPPGASGPDLSAAYLAALQVYGWGYTNETATKQQRNQGFKHGKIWKRQKDGD